MNIYDTINSASTVLAKTQDFNHSYRQSNDKTFKGIFKKLPYFIALCTTGMGALLYSTFSVQEKLSTKITASVLIGGGAGIFVAVAGATVYYAIRVNIKLIASYHQYKTLNNQLHQLKKNYQELHDNIYNSCVVQGQKIDVGYTALLLANMEYKAGLTSVYNSPIWADKLIKSVDKIEQVINESLVMLSKITGSGKMEALSFKTDEKKQEIFTVREKIDFPLSVENVRDAWNTPEISAAFLIMKLGAKMSRFIGEITERHIADIDTFCTHRLRVYGEKNSQKLIDFFTSKSLSAPEISRVLEVTKRHFTAEKYVELVTRLKSSMGEPMVTQAIQSIGQTAAPVVLVEKVGNYIKDTLIDEAMFKNLEIIKIHRDSVGDKAQMNTIEADINTLKKNWASADYMDNGAEIKKDILECMKVISETVSDIASEIAETNKKETGIMKKQYLRNKK